MNFTFFEVWAIDEDGHEELVHTTSSKSEAMKVANQFLEENEQFLEIWVSQENEQGELDEIARLTIDDSGAIINA